MLPKIDSLRIAPVTAGAAVTATQAAADPRQEEFERNLAGQLGKTMRADVLARLQDGSFVVKVAGTPARMLLPQSTQVGASISLHLIATSPRPTFQFDSGSSGSSPKVLVAEADAAYLPSPASAGPRGAPLVYAAGAGVHPQAATATALQATPSGIAAAAPSEGAAPAVGAAQAKPGSLGAMLLSKAPLTPSSQLPAYDPQSSPTLLSEGARAISGVLAAAARATPQASVVASQPLLDGRTIDPKHLAAALREAVGKSGLFYESHLREWSAGERPLAELAREPQMQRMAEGAPPRNPGVDPESAAFVSLQLATQEQARISWTGQLLPGQPVRWEIEREVPDKENEQRSESDPGWRSGMTFRFEGLGEIAATVVLSGGKVHVRLEADSAAAADRMRSEAGALGDSLGAAGAPLASLSIRGGAGHG